MTLNEPVQLHLFIEGVENEFTERNTFGSKLKQYERTFVLFSK